MGPLSPLLVVAALSTAEFCAKPIDGGVGEPEFCRIYERQEISTPYFSIVVKPDFIVGVLVIAGITLAVMLIVVMRKARHVGVRKEFAPSGACPSVIKRSVAMDWEILRCSAYG